MNDWHIFHANKICLTFTRAKNNSSFDSQYSFFFEPKVFLELHARNATTHKQQQSRFNHKNAENFPLTIWVNILIYYYFTILLSESGKSSIYRNHSAKQCQLLKFYSSPNWNFTTDGLSTYTRVGSGESNSKIVWHKKSKFHYLLLNELRRFLSDSHLLF